MNEAKLLQQAGYLALTAYPNQGRGVVVFMNETPHYVPRQSNMPGELLSLVDTYLPEQEFLVIPSNHLSVTLVDFASVGVDLAAGTEPISEDEYNQELEAVLAQLREQGLDPIEVDKLRRMTLAFKQGEFSLAGYSPEAIAIVQALSEEGATGNFQAIVDFYKGFQ